MMGYIRSFLALFVLLMLLLYLVPGERFKKYIRFFTEIILTLGFLSPVLSFLFDGDAFLEMIEYEEFTAGLSEISRDMERVEYIQQDYYLGEYETAIEEDVKRIAEQYGFAVEGVDVELNAEYTLDAIWLSVTSRGEEEAAADRIAVEKITLENGGGEEGAEIYAELKAELAEYYQMDEALIEIQYLGES